MSGPFVARDTLVRIEVNARPPAPSILEHYYRCQAIVEHRRKYDAAPLWQRIGHALLVGWRCPACRAFKRGEHKKALP